MFTYNSYTINVLFKEKGKTYHILERFVSQTELIPTINNILDTINSKTDIQLLSFVISYSTYLKLIGTEIERKTIFYWTPQKVFAPVIEI